MECGVEGLAVILLTWKKYDDEREDSVHKSWAENISWQTYYNNFLASGVFTS